MATLSGCNIFQICQRRIATRDTTFDFRRKLQSIEMPLEVPAEAQPKKDHTLRSAVIQELPKETFRARYLCGLIAYDIFNI